MFCSDHKETAITNMTSSTKRNSLFLFRILLGILKGIREVRLDSALNLHKQSLHLI